MPDLTRDQRAVGIRQKKEKNSALLKFEEQREKRERKKRRRERKKYQRETEIRSSTSLSKESHAGTEEPKAGMTIY